MINDTLSTNGVEAFWKSILEDDKNYNDNADWISQHEEMYRNSPEQEWTEITKNEVTAAVRNISNWKSSSIDNVSNFWLKNCETLHEDMARCYNKIMKEPSENPLWLTQGVTYLLPKAQETNPKNYRPITCLPISYQVLTSIIAERAYSHLEENNLMPAEQKGCKKGSYGCKDQPLINKMILEEFQNKRKNLSTALIDYRKAFDSISHSWIIKALQMYKVSPYLISYIRDSKSTWQTTMILNYSSGSIATTPLESNGGYFREIFCLFCCSACPLHLSAIY